MKISSAIQKYFKAIRHEPAPGKNILVLSDLHLGTELGLKRGIKTEDSGFIKQALASFLNYYSTNKIEDQPWTLILNGDIIEFLSIQIKADEAKKLLNSLSYSKEVSDQPRIGAVEACEKLKEIAENYVTIFREFANFISNNNEIVVIPGNHDPEFQWTLVQECFREIILSYIKLPRWRWQSAKHKFESKISFFPWFYYIPKLLYAEHGHQYDEYCSFDNFLFPVNPMNPDLMEPSIASEGLKHFMVKVPAFEADGYDSIGMKQYLSWTLGLGIREFSRITYHFMFYFYRIIQLWKGKRSQLKQEQQIKWKHILKLKNIARISNLDLNIVKKIENLTSQPAYVSLGKIIQLFFIDRILLIIFSLLLLQILIWTLPGYWKLLTLILVPAFASFGYKFLGRFRNMKPDKRFNTVVTELQSMLQVPFIIFGHSHYPAIVEIKKNAWFLNTGSWGQSRDKNFKLPYLLLRAFKGHRSVKLLDWDQYSDSSINLDN